jgi:hypothetical protein
MSGPQFFQTNMGARFYQATMPRIAEALEKIAKKLDEQPIQSGDQQHAQPAAVQGIDPEMIRTAVHMYTIFQNDKKQKEAAAELVKRLLKMCQSGEQKAGGPDDQDRVIPVVEVIKPEPDAFHFSGPAPVKPPHNGVAHEMRVKRTVQEVLDQGCVADSMFRDIMREAMTKGLETMTGQEMEDLWMLTEDEEA